MRRRYPAEKRAQLVALVTIEGAPILEAAHQLGVRPSTAYYWIRQAAKASSRPATKRARGAEPKSPAIAQPAFLQLVRASEPAAWFDVRVGPASISVKPGFDPELLRALVTALSGASS